MTLTKCSHCKFDRQSKNCKQTIDRSIEGYVDKDEYFLHGKCVLFARHDEDPSFVELNDRIADMTWLLVYLIDATDFSSGKIESFLKATKESKPKVLVVYNCENVLTLAKQIKDIDFNAEHLIINFYLEKKNFALLKTLKEHGKMTPCLITEDMSKDFRGEVLAGSVQQTYFPKTNELYKVRNYTGQYSIGYVGAFLYEPEPVCQYLDLQS